MEGPVAVFAALVSIVSSAVGTVLAVLEYRSKRHDAVRRRAPGGTVYGRARVSRTEPEQPTEALAKPLSPPEHVRRTSVWLYAVSAVAAVVVLALFLPLTVLAMVALAMVVLLILYAWRHGRAR
jgi:Flp pilus assembly protein TadB